MAIHVKRVYEAAAASDGARFLVDRLWPRGVKKESLKLDAWLKDAAPSHDLRRWFGDDAAKWAEFKRRYAAELDANPDAWQPIVEAARRGDVTLLYSKRDEVHNNAVALREYVEGRLLGLSRVGEEPELYAEGGDMDSSTLYRTSWAMLVGINQYQHCGPLTYAVADAHAIADVLRDDYGFPKSQVVCLEDARATKQNILSELERLQDKSLAEFDDRVVIFFAGHGTTQTGVRGEQGFFVPVDGEAEKTQTLILWDDIVSKANHIAAKHVLFIVDTCYSGFFGDRGPLKGSTRFVSDMLQRTARQVITAGKADERVADGGRPNGRNSLFTDYLIRGLRGDAADENGTLTANYLMAYVYKRVSQDGRSAQTPHFCNLYDCGDGDLIFRVSEGEHDYLITTPDEVSEQPSIVLPPSQTTDSFIVSNGYADPRSSNFGQNDWANYLMQHPVSDEGEVIRAYSWVAFVAAPSAPDEGLLDVRSHLRELQGLYKTQHYSAAAGPPFERFVIPAQIQTAHSTVVFFDPHSRAPKMWERFLRITSTGHLEFAESYPVFLSRDHFKSHSNIRAFNYIRMIGLFWKFLFFAKSRLEVAGYTGPVQFLFNMVRTRGSLLFNFAKGKAQHWKDPLVRSDWLDWPEDIQRRMCHDSNLQFRYDLSAAKIDEESSRSVIEDLASKLDWAYNWDSGTFPPVLLQTLRLI